MTVGGNVQFKGKVVMGSYASQHGISKQAILKVTGGSFDVESWSVPSEAALVSLTGGTFSARFRQDAWPTVTWWSRMPVTPRTP